MKFKDRIEAGELLCKKLKKYQNKDVVVYALPRGGVETASPIAKFLHAPLDLVIARKISHPSSPEYAIAAVAENGHILGNKKELMEIDEDFLEEEMEKQRKEAKRRRQLYLHSHEMISPKGKIAILVDDGVATGLTLRVGILELKHRKPKKIIVAVPVVPRSTASILKSESDELVALEIPSDEEFLGAVGAYYDSFNQLTDQDVIRILKENRAFLTNGMGEFSTPNGRVENGYIMRNEP